MLGPYRVTGRIGEGGMGAVYRATDTRLGRNVAIKVLTAVTLSDKERLQRFEQEARATGMLNHPNLLTIYDVGNSEGTPFLVSELLEGETLRERLDHGAIPPRKSVEIALQIAHGLAAAHEKGIIHRDLKPENIYITKEGRVKILDFGIAKLSATGADDGPKFQMAATEPGMVLGTVGYMSPEQVRGEAIDNRSDIFAFGAILYEMLSGSRAFKRNSAIETLGAILKEDPADLTETQTAGVRHLAVECYKAVECEGMARVDFLLEAATGKFYINEINTIPGFTSISMYPKMWVHSGLAYPALIDRLIELAIARQERKKATRFTR